MNDNKIYYYRIYDDQEELNFFKSSLDEKRIRQLLKEYENSHQKYVNPDFVSFLKDSDNGVELITITNISY